jgi:hypothetical protein
MTGALDRLRFTADRLTQRFGKAVTLTRVENTFDPATGETTETRTDNPTVSTPPAEFNVSRIDGTLVKQGDVQLAVPAVDLSIAPDPDTDEVKLDGLTYQIVRVSPEYSGEKVARYIMQVRR